MSDKKDKPTLRQDNRPEYEPPRATHLRGLQAGSGGFTCFSTGSGDTVGCQTGTGAGGDGCINNGNSANGNCSNSGNSVL